MAQLEERWRQAQLNVARAVHGTGITARIHDNERKHECTVTFEKDGLKFIKRNVDIATVEDQPSSELDRMVQEAKRALIP